MINKDFFIYIILRLIYINGTTIIILSMMCWLNYIKFKYKIFDYMNTHFIIPVRLTLINKENFNDNELLSLNHNNNDNNSLHKTE